MLMSLCSLRKAWVYWMNRHFFRELLEENPRLLQKMMQFNGRALELYHLPRGGIWDAVERYPNLVAALTRGQTKEDSLALREPVYWGFTEESHRLAFLSSTEIARLSRIVAVAVYAEEIAKTVDRESVLAVKKFLGEDLYNYGLSRARFQIGSLRKSLLTVFDRGSLSERLAWMARLSVEVMRRKWPVELLEKTDSVFSQLDYPSLPANVQVSDEVRRQLWYFMKKIILREFDQKWAQYFA